MSEDRDILLLGDLDLNDQVNFFKLEGTDWGALSFGREQRRKLRGIAGWGPQRRDGWIEVPTPPRIMVKPSTPGDGEELLALLGLLDDEIAKESNTITAVPRGMLTPVTMPVVFEKALGFADDIRLTVTRSPIAELTGLWRSPYAYLAPVTEGPTTLTTPCVVDLSAMTGEYDTLIDMLFSAPTANDLTELWVAYIPADETAACAWADALSWIVEAEGLSWDGGAAAHDTLANPAAGNNVWDCSPTTIYLAQIDTAAFPPGPYVALARSRAASELSIGGFRLVVNGVMTTFASMPSRLGYDIVEVDSAMLPPSLTRGSAPNLIQLMLATSAAHQYVDWCAFLPTRWGYWHWKKASGHVHTVERVGETLYTAHDSATDLTADLAECVGAAIEGLRGRLLIVAQGTSVTEATHAVALTRTHTPRLTLW